MMLGASPPPPPPDAFTVVVQTLKKEEAREVRLSLIGALGIALLGGTAWLFWRKR